jgi:hypothetical protein
MSVCPNCPEIPDDAVILSVLHIVEYLDPNGELVKADYSHDGADQELELGKVLELAEWAKAIAVMPLIVNMIEDEDDEDDEEKPAKV